MSNANRQSFIAANQTFQQGFSDGDKASPPARKVAIVTCMDARIHIEPALGLKIGDAHVIRNAGGRVSNDALRSLAISERLLGTTEIFVIHHTDCGMIKFNNDKMCEILKKDLGDTAETHGKKFDWLFFTDLEGSVRDDVKIIRESPLIPKEIEVHGFVYDVKSGSLVAVE